MKNIYKIIAILLITATLLCGCSTVVETQVQTIEKDMQTPTKDSISLPTYITSVDDIGQIVYFEETDEVGYTLDKFENSKYRDIENGIITINETLGPRVVKEDVPKKITWNFLGNELELEYKYSSVFSYGGSFIDDTYVDCYECGSKYREVYFLHGTNYPVQMYWHRMDNWPSDLETYEDYLCVVYSVLDDFVDLDRYEVSCTTSFENQEGEYEDIDGFYKIKSDENLIWYKFFFDLTINDIKTVDRIIFGFNPDLKSIAINCNIAKYNSDKVSEIDQDEIEYACDLTNDFIDEYTSKLTIRKPAHFFGVDTLNGRIYLVINVTVPWSENEKSDEDLRFYVDYERLQWKMALEGKT